MGDCFKDAVWRGVGVVLIVGLSSSSSRTWKFRTLGFVEAQY
jgi:hypothetical protein